ncbi:MAG: HAD family hydrolase [Treponema sp.]|nr:HAD family hydrolase [Treponema sp.]
MEMFNIPSKMTTSTFDIDSTPDTNDAYAFEQIDCQVREFARVRGMSADAARKMVADYRKKFAEEHDGKKVSLGNTLVSFGVPIEQSVQWRNELMAPEKFLSYDEKIVEEIKILKSKYNLVCVTNNPVLPARKTLEVIGISEYFPVIVGLDTCYKSKPAVEPFMTAVEKMGAKVSECVAIGDRYDLDIALPLELGMGGILVKGVEEIYGINRLLQK